MSLRIVLASAACGALAATGALVVAPSAAAAGTPAALRSEATGLMTAPLDAFLAAKSLAVAPFDWSDDGCSVPGIVRDVYATIFATACERHDFGYRNYGRGLRLDPTDKRRKAVDVRFRSDMLAICKARETRWPDTCETHARTYYAAVRLAGWTAFYG